MGVQCYNLCNPSPSKDLSVQDGTNTMALTGLSRETFVQYLGRIYEGSPWVVQRAYDAGLEPQHNDPEVLARQFNQIIVDASPEEKMSLILAQKELVSGDERGERLSGDAMLERASAGLDRCTPEQIERFHDLNRLYWGKFGFPFVMDVSNSSADEILHKFSERVKNENLREFGIALAEVQSMARKRLNALNEPAALDGTGSSAKASTTEDETAMTREGMTLAQMRDPDYFPGFIKGLPLGIQHVLAMFVSNITPAIIIAGAVGFGFGSEDTSDMIYMIQMSMLFAGVATLIQTISLGPIGARLPIVQGTSFAFIPVMIPIAKVYGMAALMGGIVIGGIFHFFLGTIIGRLRQWLPPLVTGLVVLMIGLALVKVGIQYAAGGVPLIGQPEYGSLNQWSLALVVIVVTLLLKFFASGMLSVSAVLLGLIAGYAVAYWQGMISFASVEQASWFALPNPLHFGFEVNAAAVIGMCLMGFVSAIETVGDISGVTKGGAGREATNKEVAGGTMADGVGTALSGLFGALPNTSFSQNVGLISMTGLMSRHVVTLGALFLVLCGLVPKVGAAIQTMPIAVLGGGVIVMFGMVAAAGVNMLADVIWNRRNMMIFAIALSVGLGLQLEPGALQHLPDTLKVLMTSGLLPSAMIAIVLNLIVPGRSDSVR